MSATPKKSKGKTSVTLKHRLFQVLGLLIPVALLGWIFLVKIPSEVSYSDVWSTLKALSLGQNLLLLIGGLLTIATYGWTSATVLPGLSLRKGIQSAVSGQLTSVVLPTPVDLVIRFSMYKSYGFSADKSTVAVAVAGIARYFTVVAIPLLGLAALLLTGQGTKSYVLWFVGGSVVFIVALWVMRIVLSSQKSAQKVGILAQRVYHRGLKIARRESDRDIKKLTVDFGSRTKTVAINHFKSIALSNIVWGLSCYLVMFMALRFCGIQPSFMSGAYILLLTGMMLLLNAFPITPGGIGVTETVLISFITFPTPQAKTAFVSAMFIYRVYTWVLPMPVGAVAYFTWRRQNKKIAEKV